MKAERFVELLGIDFYAGVPDSLLKDLCACLMERFGLDAKHHLIAANEGNAVGLAAGYHLATGRVPAVYMQNSGEGNIINPLASLLNDKVYAMPALFIIGWRGEPGVHDEPQHVYQGMVTEELMKVMDVESFIFDKDTTEDELKGVLGHFKELFAKGKQAAIIVRKGALSYDGSVKYENPYKLNREEAVGIIAEAAGDGVIISTTGKISRELFEYRTAHGGDHSKDFLTVGSMGHASSIALEVAANMPDKKVYCIDGDGALLMHMGALALNGSIRPENLIHIVINNEAHETVGGMPTVAGKIKLPELARACGYPAAMSVSGAEALKTALTMSKGADALTFIEVKCALGARADLGRPTTTAVENKENFMKYLGSDKS